MGGKIGSVKSIFINEDNLLFVVTDRWRLNDDESMIHE